MRCFKRILFLFSIGMAFWGCTQSAFEQENSFALQPGDLLFQDLDSGPLCDAIEKVTTGFGGMNFSHLGIAPKDDSGNFVVIEAVSSGVEATALQSFLSRSFDDQHQPKVAVGRLKRPYRHLIPPAIKEANALKAKPYDKVFAIDNDVYYCSELIYEIFLRANNNNPLFSLQPMTFKDPSTGEILSAWKDYFSELSASLPEGQPGINPGGISRSRFLNIIHTYGNPSRNQ
jgi:hypothetical protein